MTAPTHVHVECTLGASAIAVSITLTHSGPHTYVPTTLGSEGPRLCELNLETAQNSGTHWHDDIDPMLVDSEAVSSAINHETNQADVDEDIIMAESPAHPVIMDPLSRSGPRTYAVRTDILAARKKRRFAPCPKRRKHEKKMSAPRLRPVRKRIE